MERFALQKLINWKNSSNRKPLIIRGARQVGKTWLMKEFGKREYKNVAYINFENSKVLQSLFNQNFDIERIITALQIESETLIDNNTLIILDEIQEAEGAITSLKYFYENAPQYDLISAGSLLGVSFHKKTSFPVGKVEFLDLHPLSYIEFLLANKQDSLVVLLNKGDWQLISSFREKYINLLRQYYFVGGMPEVVNTFIQNKDFKAVREIQKQILAGYELDFSKHAPYEIVPRIRMVWNSIPAQLAKENRKFIYSVLKSGARAKDYELALAWLIDSGLANKVCRISKPGIPLKGYEDYNAFKLFINDVGLLSAMIDVDIKTLLEGNKMFTEFKGALTEQYVLQQLKSTGDEVVYYWSAEKSKSEIDFVVQYSNSIFAVEVKAEENLQAKSLKTFYNKFPEINAIRSSMSNFRKEEWLINLPLYAIHKIGKLFYSS